MNVSWIQLWKFSHIRRNQQYVLLKAKNNNKKMKRKTTVTAKWSLKETHSDVCAGKWVNTDPGVPNTPSWWIIMHDLSILTKWLTILHLRIPDPKQIKGNYSYVDKWLGCKILLQRHYKGGKSVWNKFMSVFLSTTRTTFFFFWRMMFWHQLLIICGCKWERYLGVYI